MTRKTQFMDDMTPNMIRALEQAARPGGVGSWDFGSATLSGLKKRGLVAYTVERRVRVYRATEAGLQRLKGGAR